MRTRRSIGVLLLTIPLVLALSLPGSATPATPGENRDGAPGAPLTGPAEGDPEDLAIAYIQREPDSLGLTSDDVEELAISSAYTSSHNGVTHVNVQQRLDGLDVFGAVVTVSILPDGSILHVGGRLVEGLAAASGRLESDAVDAVEAAADALNLDEPDDLAVLERPAGAERRTVLTDGGIAESEIPARLGWQVTDAGLRLAWQVEIDEASEAHLWSVAVDAESGELLDVQDWTDHDPRAELDERLQRMGPATSSALSNLSDEPRPGATVFKSANPARDGSSYRIFPQESPDDSDRILSVEPADGNASPFGWHDVDGVPGPEYTITRGNNVHAYTDRDNDGNEDPGGAPDGGPSLTFDFALDLNEHPQNNVAPQITNLFWWCNTFHDLTWLYGFDEASGNFQVNNYGRGGTGGDDVRCEGMDGSGENNANFSTPAADGGRPRMQTFIERGTGLPNAVTLSSGPAAGTYLAMYARFSPAPTTAGTPGTLVLVDDGEGNPNDGCQPYTLPEGSIAVVDTSTACNNYQQTVNAEAAGAVAIVVVHTANNPTLMSGSMNPPVSIPAIRVGLADGNVIKAAIAESPTPGLVHRNTQRPPMRVGEHDVATIIHEYGHGVSNRLTGGLNINCLSGQEQMGEGWSDFFAVTALIDIGIDDPEQPRGIFPYVIYAPPRSEDGLRVRPYSRNMDINPFTYDNIKTGGWMGGSISAPHGIGWGWATILWDMVWDLIDEHGFNPNLYDSWDTGGNNLAYQLVMDGLKIQGCGPGFVAGRDGILAADVALTGGENACLLWNSFARRGLGYSAIQGTTDRNDNTQAFDLPPGCSPTVRLIQAQLDREARAELAALVAAGGITEGLQAKIEHAFDMFDEWIENPRQRGPALSHLRRAVHLLLWQADVVDSGKPNQGDAAALRALAATVQRLIDFVES